MAQRSYNLVALLVGCALLSPAFGRPHNPPQGNEVPIILPVLPPQLGEPVSAAANQSEHSPTHRVALKEGECGAGHTCPGNLCCSQYNYCGNTDDYCGQGCQGGPCKGKGGGCQDGNPALCQSWGTKYCDPKYSYEGRSVAFDLCKKTCNHCSGPTPNPPPRDYHQQMLDLVNQGRRENGRAPLCLNYKLNAAAQAHSQDMYVNKFFSHTGSDGSRPAQRTERQGYNGGGWIAENIAQGNNDATATFNQWKNSPGHWANILGDYKHMGIGKASNYWTQVFGKGASESCLGEHFVQDSHGFSQE